MAAYLCSRSACEVYVESPQRYCEAHRCTADACRNAKRSSSRFCAGHLKCLKTDCLTPRHNPDGDEHIPPFCTEHYWSCRNLDCTSVSDYSANSPFCTAHGCQFPACRIPVSSGLRSCATHACTISGCAEPIREGFRACSNHICQHPGCPYTVCEGRTACAAHICRITTITCIEMGADYHQGRYYCITHTCNASGCLESTGATPEHSFTNCSRHRCAAQPCAHARRENSDYCRNHALCGKLDCQVTKNIVERFCPAHNNTCIHAGCPNTQMEYGHTEWWDPGLFRSWRSYFVRDGFREHCSNHACVAQDCSNITEYAQGRRYCHQHEVCGKLNCSYSRLVDERFCNFHRTSCKEPDCSSCIGQTSEYCTVHACAMAGSGCTLRRQESRTLCDQHRTCTAPGGCSAVCTSPRVACDQHTCYIQGCEGAACNLDCRYCHNHVCARDGCFDPQDRVYDYSATHTFCSNHKPVPRPPERGRSRYDSGASWASPSTSQHTRRTHGEQFEHEVDDRESDQDADGHGFSLQ